MMRVFCGHLHRLAIGHPVKVDLDTLRVEYGRFARVCVDIDIRYTVAGKIGINGEWYEVQYEKIDAYMCS
jgi:hypothetical protein